MRNPKFEEIGELINDGEIMENLYLFDEKKYIYKKYSLKEHLQLLVNCNHIMHSVY